MNLEIITIRDFVGKGFLKQGTTKKYIDFFKNSLDELLESLKIDESEEHNKNIISDFLKKIFKRDDYKINTSEKIDLSITNKGSKNIGVIIETKSLKNRTEFPTKDNINVKAFHELILYYLREKNKGNNDIKNLIITNGKEWFIFDVTIFYENFYFNKIFFNSFLEFEKKNTEYTNTDYFYKEISKSFLDNFEGDISFCYFNIEDIKENEIIFLSKIISPVGLLKENYQTDNNTLDKGFYSELLHILGLEEIKENKILIKRKLKDKRDNGTLLENAISRIESLKKIENFKEDISFYGKDKEDQIFNICLELCITWINRILFLKLLEGQIVSYNKDEKLKFLNYDKIKDFNELNNLFFDVLAKKANERDNDFKEFENVPYLNSSLFEIQYIENEFIVISNLKDNIEIPLYSNTVLIDNNDRKMTGKMNTIEYLFRFLDSYDFASDGSLGDSLIRENNKTLINASVLGLVFEKINGYKDGSFYTPSFITMYMCRETIRKVVLDKFNDINKWDCKDFSDLYNNIKDKEQANEIINNIKICDPSVGSGHFLVSALNEIILIKKELDILIDDEGKLLKNYDFEIQNDEIIITDEENNFFEYNRNSKESLRIQKTLFNEKKKIIENCLFGVDINPNSVKICNLRLWIELLKNSYYKEDTNDLETLPNIDINIKCGNSLVSKLDLFSNPVFIDSTKQSSYYKLMEKYREKVVLYKNFEGNKLQIRREIKEIRDNISLNIPNVDKDYKEIKKIENDISDLLRNTFGKNELENKKLDLLNTKLLEKQKVYNEKQELFKNYFEWRLEFPEVLDEKGNFLGFDAIIGNPPYIKEYTNREAFIPLKYFKYYQGKMDLWYFFTCYGLDLLKEGGILSFIVPNNWTTNFGASIMRNKIISDSKIEKILDFSNYMIFDSADIQTMIMILSKDKISDGYYFNYTKLDSENSNYRYLKDEQKKGNVKQEIFTPLIFREKSYNKMLTFFNNKKDIILNKIRENKNFILYEDEELAQGIVIPQDYVNRITQKILGEKYSKGDGIFVLSEKEKKNLNLTQEETKLIKPYYTTEQIQKYYCKPKNTEWIIYTNSKYKKEENILPYPNIKKHLDQFKNVITSDNKPYGLHRSREESFFIGEKIIVLRKCVDEPKFTYTDFDCYVSATFYVIKSNRINLKYLTGFLNSKLIFFWLKNKGKMQGNNFQLDKEPLLQIPIFEPNIEIQERIIEIVDKILIMKSKGEDTIKQEKHIDQIFYELYSLNQEEINIIEERGV